MRPILPLLLLAACEPREPASLVDPTGWLTADPADDPFPDHRPEDDFCALGSVFVEADALEVDTGTCRYALLVQPTVVEARRGDTLHLDAYHDALVASEPADAHLHVRVGDLVLLDEIVPIPSPWTPYTADVEVPETMPVGTPVVLHLHNHGSNRWTLLALEDRPPE